MDYVKILKEMQQGSRIQRKRKELLDKKKQELLKKCKSQKENKDIVKQLEDTIKGQLAYAKKIKEGNTNSLRTLKLRLFFLRFHDKKLWKELKDVKDLAEAFTKWLFYYNSVVQDKNLEGEKRCNESLHTLLTHYEKKNKQLRKMLNAKDIKKFSYLMLGILILTATILLFKETEEIKFNKEIFNHKNRHNPLNPFFPLKMPKSYS